MSGGAERKQPAREGGNGVPQWMADLGIKPGEWLNLSKAQLRSQQRPDRPLKVQVWATGMLHSPGYQGQEATTMRNGKRVPLTPGDISTELFALAKQHYQTAGVRPTEEQLFALKEDKESIRRALSGLEDDGLCMRADIKGTPLRDLSVDEVRRLPSGRTRIFFWLTPRAPDPIDVASEWKQRQSPEPPTPEVGKECLPLPPIWKILNLFQIAKPEKSQMADPEYQKKVTAGWVAARNIFIEVVNGCLPVVGTDCPPEVGATRGAFERIGERKAEREEAPPSSPEVISTNSSSVGRSSLKAEVAAAQQADRPTDEFISNPFKPKIRGWLESKVSLPVPLEEPELDQIAATIQTQAHFEQFQTAALRQKNPRGWKVFVKIALECQKHQGKYQQANPAEETYDERWYRKEMERRAKAKSGAASG